MPSEKNPPFAATVDDAVRLSGISKTELYGLLKAGTIRGKKYGRKTLILLDGLRRYVDDLPDAKIGQGQG